VNEERVHGTRAIAAGDAIRFGTTIWRLVDADVGAVGAPRGDVPPPPERPPSAIRRVLPPPPGAASFEPMPPPRRRGSAATRMEATIVCFTIVAATAIALVLYFALYEP
jgi:hypothetical protein